MELSRRFPNLRFPESVIRRAISVIEELPEKKAAGKLSTLSTQAGTDTWKYNEAGDFFAAFPNARYATLSYEVPLKSDYWYCRMAYRLYSDESCVDIDAQTSAQINAVMNVFQSSLESAIQINPPGESRPSEPQDNPRVFLGHGRSNDWQDLKNHLQDKHGFEVIAFESGARAGHHIRDILEEMLSKSSIAFLVLTGEDELAGKQMRARQNVIHETGLFQGRLGFSRAIVLLEDGVEEFSNLAGIQHISFAKGHINGTFGEVLAVIRREFGRHAWTTSTGSVASSDRTQAGVLSPDGVSPS